MLYWSAIVGLFVFSGFRFEVGCDWWGYLEMFLQPMGSYQEVFTTREVGYWALISTLNELELPYQYLNLITSALFFIGLNSLARRQPNPLSFLALAFPILIINMPMSAIRQGVAIGFLCFALGALIDRRIFPYVSWILAGALFHSSILMFLVFSPLAVVKLKLSTLLKSSALIAPVAYMVLHSEAVDVAQSRYLGTGIDSYGAAFRLGLLSLTGLFFLTKVASSWRRDFPKDYNLVMIGSWLMIAFFGLFFYSTVIGDRMGYYLIPIQLMVLTRLPYLKSFKDRKIWSPTPYFGLTLVFIVWTQYSWFFNTCYVPYDIRLNDPLGMNGKIGQ